MLFNRFQLAGVFRVQRMKDIVVVTVFSPSRKIKRMIQSIEAEGGFCRITPPWCRELGRKGIASDYLSFRTRARDMLSIDDIQLSTEKERDEIYGETRRKGVFCLRDTNIRSYRQ